MANKPKTHSDTGEKCTSVLTRNSSSTYRNSCTNPHPMPTGELPWKNQIHHILCEHAILDIEPSGDVDGSKLIFIEECLCIADWKINDTPNLIGLPLKPAYIKSKGKTPQNLPCHEVDHPDYTVDCREWLHTHVWNRLIDRRKAHKTNAETIVKALIKCSGTHKGIITKRGQRGPGRCGTQKCWRNRFEDAYEYEWYKPFSMSSDPRYRSPGGRWSKPLFSILSKIG